MNELEMLHFNGINGATGKPVLSPLSPVAFAEKVYQADLAEKVKMLERRNRLNRLYEAKNQNILGVREGYNAEDVEDVGWGVIFHPEVPEDVRKALQVLVEHRKGWKPFTYIPGESAYQFRLRHKQGHGVVDPKKLPYYILLVGSPMQIPFEFQYDLDAEHAVGRLYFETPIAYTQYVEALMEYEQASQSGRKRELTFFSPNCDKNSAMSSKFLAGPLARLLNNREITSLQGKKHTFLAGHKDGNAALRATLEDLLGNQKQSLLFTASHGMWFDPGHPCQATDQGAILCQDWMGIEGEVNDKKYFSGKRLTPDFDLSGLVIFSFACYSAGTPLQDEFALFTEQNPKPLAPAPFIAYLGQQMLARRALGFIGHIDRAWSYSFGWPGTGGITSTFEDALLSMLKGVPLGHALDYFNRRYLDLNNHLTSSNGLFDLYANMDPVEAELVEVWTARNDARSYILLGDPAARLRPEILAAA